MAKNTSFALGVHFEEYIRQRVDAGHFASASEVVRAALREMEEREQRTAALDAALAAGIADLDAGRTSPHAEVVARSRARRAERRAK